MHPKIKNQVDYLDWLRNQFLRLRTELHNCESVCEQVDFPVVVEVREFLRKAVVTIHAQPRSRQDVADLLRLLAHKGYTQDHEPCDCQETSTRMYELHGGRVWVHALFRSSSSCRFVQTGTEQKPVYELQCAE